MRIHMHICITVQTQMQTRGHQLHYLKKDEKLLPRRLTHVVLPRRSLARPSRAQPGSRLMRWLDVRLISGGEMNGKPANIGRRAEANGARFALAGDFSQSRHGAREPQSGWVLAPRSASHAWHRGWCVEPACSAPYLTRSLARWGQPVAVSTSRSHASPRSHARLGSKNRGKKKQQQHSKKLESESVFLFSHWILW